MIDSGDTAWMLISCGLVLLMTPGLAFFYSGLCPTRSVVNTIKMSFICLAIIPLVWAVIGYSLVFAKGNGFIGGFEFFMLNGVDRALSPDSTIPRNLFMAFQMMFAVITPALVSGALVGRMRFFAYVVFVILWSLFVYCPIAHWVWGPGGWLAKRGALDFAGGTVVHINAGFAALIAASILGRRIQKLGKHEPPHNVPFVVLGASLLWFGWYGFNAGSALAANSIASHVVVTTTLATSASISSWTIMSWLTRKPASAIGSAIAAVVGLVSITPACAYVSVDGAIIIGFVAAMISFFALIFKTKILRHIDDTLDVFICHGLGGIVGSILTGILASQNGGQASFHQFYEQCIAVGATILWTSCMTAFILFALKFVMPIRATKQAEIQGIDIFEHGEIAYDNVEFHSTHQDSD